MTTNREPLLVAAMRRHPGGEVRLVPAGGAPSSGTTARGFLREMEDFATAVAEAARAEALVDAERAIAASVSYGFGMRHDGTEDPKAAIYTEGLHDAWVAVRSLSASSDAETEASA